MANPNIVQRRPAETAAPVSMALAILISAALGVDNEMTIGYIAIVVSFVPAAVTWLIEALRRRAQ